jgi:hypothetical protein
MLTDREAKKQREEMEQKAEPEHGLALATSQSMKDRRFCCCLACAPSGVSA